MENDTEHYMEVPSTTALRVTKQNQNQHALLSRHLVPAPSTLEQLGQDLWGEVLHMDDEPAHILEVDAMDVVVHLDFHVVLDDQVVLDEQVLLDDQVDDEVVLLDDEVVLHHMVQAVVGKAPA